METSYSDWLEVRESDWFYEQGETVSFAAHANWMKKLDKGEDSSFEAYLNWLF